MELVLFWELHFIFNLSSLNISMNKSIVFFTGFMGSGKSTLGPIVANTLGWQFYDLDKLIEESSGMRVRDIFQKNGEEYFRNLEYVKLKSILSNEPKIISLGGGTIINEKNFKLVKESGLLVYLKVSPQEAFKRLKYKRDRPVLLSGLEEDFTDEDMMRNIETVLEKRQHIYEQADVIFETSSMYVGKTIDLLIKQITKELNKNV